VKFDGLTAMAGSPLPAPQDAPPAADEAPATDAAAPATDEAPATLPVSGGGSNATQAGILLALLGSITVFGGLMLYNKFDLRF